MTPNITMTKQEEIIYLIPFILEDYPREAMTIALVHQNEQSTDSVFGPVARKPLARLERDWHDSASALVEEFNATDVFLVAYVNDLEQTLADGVLVRQMHECALATQKTLDERYKRDDMGFVSAFITDYTEWIPVNSYRPTISTDNLRDMGLIHSNDEFKNGQMAAEIAFAGHAVPEQDEIPDIAHAECERAEDAYIRKHTNARQKKAVKEVFTGTASAEDYGIANQVLENLLMRDRLLLASLAGLDVEEVWALDEDDLEEQLMQIKTTAPTTLERARMFDRIAGHLPNNNAPALSCSGYLRWWIGERASAHARATDANYNDPEYNLARLVLYAIKIELDSPAQQ